MATKLESSTTVERFHLWRRRAFIFNLELRSMTHISRLFALTVGAILLAASLLVLTHPARSAEPAKWTGIYAGASVGYASTTTETGLNWAGLGNVLTVDGFGAAGTSLAAHVGADIRIQNFVLGGFADWTKHDQEWSISSPFVGGTFASMKIEDAWTLGGRAGVLVGDTLIYGLIGYTTMSASDIAVPAVPLTIVVGDFKGWTLGGGLETHLGNNIFLAAEYRYTKFDGQTVDIATTPLSLSLEPETHEVKARVSYKFGLDLK